MKKNTLKTLTILALSFFGFAAANAELVSTGVELESREEIAVTKTFEEVTVLELNDWKDIPFNRYGIKYQSNRILKGTIHYTLDGNEINEDFFLGKNQNPNVFYSFIDAYSIDNTGNKRGLNLSSISFRTLDGKNCTLQIYGIGLYEKEKMPNTLYISDNNLKLGINLNWGGGIEYLERLNANVEAVRLGNSQVKVSKDAQAKYGGTLLTKNVNLINRHDTGRSVQQSYYGSRGNGDGYEKWFYAGGNDWWPYNPVQGGNVFNESSKIVEYKITENEIYVKCQPLDWAKPREYITPSYMEQRYTLVNGTVKSLCRFTDYSPYNHPEADQEIPALYCIEPLNSYRYYGGANPWENDLAISRKDDLAFWVPDYPRFNTTEYWSAFTNDETDGFGLAMYVPDNKSTLVGIFKRGEYIQNDPSLSDPASYIAVVSRLRIKQFIPLEYSFLLTAGNLSEMRQAIYDNKNLISNQSLLDYINGNVTKLEYVPDDASVNNSDFENVRIISNNNELIISDLSGQTKVSCYNLSGEVIFEDVAGNNFTKTISQGFYLIKLTNQNGSSKVFKCVVR